MDSFISGLPSSPSGWDFLPIPRLPDVAEPLPKARPIGMQETTDQVLEFSVEFFDAMSRYVPEDLTELKKKITRHPIVLSTAHNRPKTNFDLCENEGARVVLVSHQVVNFTISLPDCLQQLVKCSAVFSLCQKVMYEQIRGKKKLPQKNPEPEVIQENFTFDANGSFGPVDLREILFVQQNTNNYLIFKMYVMDELVAQFENRQPIKILTKSPNKRTKAGSKLSGLSFEALMALREKKIKEIRSVEKEFVLRVTSLLQRQESTAPPQIPSRAPSKRKKRIRVSSEKN